VNNLIVETSGPIWPDTLKTVVGPSGQCYCRPEGFDGDRFRDTYPKKSRLLKLW